LQIGIAFNFDRLVRNENRRLYLRQSGGPDVSTTNVAPMGIVAILIAVCFRLQVAVPLPPEMKTEN
jgi:hypothetical protein